MHLQRTTLLTLPALIHPILAIPAPTPTATPTPTSPLSPGTPDTHQSLNRRQSLPDLLSLAAAAGIPLPTNPAALISLYPLATQLLAYLPTSPVLSVLETAVPSGFLSQIIHDPSFAASFEQAFASGSPPGWFSSLPSGVRSYLHTYEVGGLVGEVGSVEGVLTATGTGTATGTDGGVGIVVTGTGTESGLGVVVTGSSGVVTESLGHSIIGEGGTTGSARVGPLVSGDGNGNGTVGGTGGAVQTQSGGMASSVVVTTSATSAAAASSGGAQSTAAATSRASAAGGASSSSTGGAPEQTGALMAGIAAAVGAMGAVALL